MWFSTTSTRWKMRQEFKNGSVILPVSVILAESFFSFFYHPIAFKLQTWQEYWALQLSECKAQCNICQPGPDVKANAQENQITALSLCNIFCVWCLCYLMTHQSKVSDLTDQPYNLKWWANRCPQQHPLSFLWQGAALHHQSARLLTSLFSRLWWMKSHLVLS